MTIIPMRQIGALLWSTVVLLGAIAAPTAAQTSTTNCRPDFLGGMQCTTSSMPDPRDRDVELLRMGMASLAASQQARAAQLSAAWLAAERASAEAAAVARLRVEQTAEALQHMTQRAVTESPTLPFVNMELPVDWSVVNGVSFSREVKAEGGIRRRFVTRLALVPTPEGNAFVQLRVDSEIRVREGLSWKPVATEVLDGRYDMATGVTLLTSSREPLRADIPPLYEAVALVGEHGWLAKMGGVSQGRVPIGTVPSPALDHLVSAIRGELPDSLQVWVVDWETGAVMPAEFTQRESFAQRLPMSSREPCEVNSGGRKEAVDVVAYRVRIGTRVEERRYLAKAPHIRVTEDLRCVAILQ